MPDHIAHPWLVSTSMSKYRTLTFIPGRPGGPFV